MVALCRIIQNSPTQIGYRESNAMNPMSIEIASCSDKGLVRDVNQDSIAAFPESGLVVLADGMGGHNAGEVASRLAVETVTRSIFHSPEYDAKAIVTAVEAANDAIFAGVQRVPEYQGMATTLVVALFQDEKIIFTHIGDSRIYRLRQGVLMPLTRDHSVIQELVDMGMYDTIEEAKDAGVKSNLLTRGVGTDRRIEVDISQEWVDPGDLFLLCSDGLSNMIPDDEICRIILANSPDIDIAVDKLLELALHNGGTDNISMILAWPRK